ncbi:hypothetical protein K0U83_23665, partial [bacterium]|nr:hypothetical protein [bacterium]
LSALNVPLNDDIRGVFDRLLATEEAIYREKQREVYKIPRELRELLNDRELKELETLSREAELEAQQEMQLLIAEELRELQSAERKAAREGFTKEATEQVHSEPVYRAQRAARKGEGPNGIEYKNAKGQKTPIKILREEAVALLGADVVRKLPRWLFTKDADAAVGMHELALLSGFGSPAEMADTIIDTPISIDSAIDAVVEDRMKQEFGDFTDEANLAEIAADVVLNDKQVELAKAQSRILKSKASGLVSTAAERQVLEEGAVSAQEAIGRVLEAETQSGFAPTAEDAVPEQLRAITAEEQRTAAIPQRKAQTAARKRITEIMRDIDPAAVKEAAARFVQSSTVKVLTPQRYIAAAERAARKADKAIAERDYEGAAALLEQRTLNLEIAKQVRDAQKKLNGTVDRIKKTLRRSDAQTATYRNVDLINLVRDVMGSAGVSKLVLVDTAAARASVLAELGADSPSYALVSDTLTSMEDALSPHLERPAPYKELTYAEATSLLNDALSLMTLARDMRTAVVQGRRVLHAEIADEVRDTATRVGKSTRKYGGTRNDRSRIASWSALKHATRRMENWARAADGGSPAGPITRSIVQPVFTAIGEYYKNRVQPLKSLVDLVVPMRAELGVEVNISAPELSSAGGAAYVFRTKGELIHAILHTGNDSNKQKLLRAGRVDIATGEKYIWGSLAEDGTLDTSRWDAFMTRMFEEGVITKADMDLVQGIWNIFAETKKAAQAAHKQMFGFEFEEISSSPVETPFGSYPGGYVPAVTDRMMDIAGGAKVDADNLASQQNASMFPGAERGFTKSRVEAYAEPLQLDLTSIASHFDRVMKFAYLGPAVREAAYLATSREFRSAVNQYDNGAVDDIIIPFLQRAARQTDSEPSKLDPLIKPLAVLSRRVGLHIMAGNLVNAAQQFTGLSVAAGIIKPHYLAKHLNTFRVDGVRIREYIAGKDPYMAERFKSGVIDFSIELDKILTDKSTLRMLEEQATRYGYTFQQVFQNLLDPVIWMAAEEQFKAGPDWQTVYKNNEHLGHDTAVERADAAAVYYASSVIRMTQTAMDPASLSAIEASNAIGKAILKFYSYFNSMLNFSETEFKLAAEEIGWSHRAGKAFYLYLTIIMVPAVAAKAIAMAAGGDLDEFEEEDDFVAKMAELFIVSQAEYVAGFIPGGSGVFRAVKGQFTDVQYDDRLTFSPTVSVVEGALQGTARLIKDAVQYYDEGEVARDGSRIIKDLLNAFALATGLPTNWFSKPLQYLQKVEEGRAEPEGVVDFVQGLLTGRDGTPQ